tara:strand:- start:43 stop:468 length:426 start_codon:yes stop_codon:yes gene_type:complete
MGNYQSGGRTRNIINVANVGGTGTAAYVFTTSSLSEPTLATDGYANSGVQENLHLMIKNTSNTTSKFVVWTYHSSFGIWGKLNIYDGTAGVNDVLTIQVAGGISHHAIARIAGAERVYVQCYNYPALAMGNTTVYLGVNTI